MGKVQLTRGRVVGGQNAQDHSPAVIRDQNYKFVYDRFSARCLFVDQDGDGIATGANGDENIMISEQYNYEYHIIGTQTIVSPTYNATKGIDLVQDLTSGEGTEVTLGIGSNGRGAFTVGTDECFFKAQLELTDVSQLANVAVGFRKVEAYQADQEDYADMAAFNILAGVINIQTILGDASTITTDTTETDWVDTETHVLEVRVNTSGVASFYYDDALTTVYPGDGTVTAFTFDDAEVIMPFIYHDLGSDGANGVFLKEWQSGLGKRSV